MPFPHAVHLQELARDDESWDEADDDLNPEELDRDDELCEEAGDQRTREALEEPARADGPRDGISTESLETLLETHALRTSPFCALKLPRNDYLGP